MLRLLPLFLLLSLPALAKDAYAGTIVGTGASKTNLTTAAPFVLNPGAHSIQCDAAASVLAGASSVTATTGVSLTAGQLYTFWLAPSETVAVLVTGSCRVGPYTAPPSGR